MDINEFLKKWTDCGVIYNEYPEEFIEDLKSLKRED